MYDADTSRPRRHVTREELYEQVWATPLTTLATAYGISNVGLAKICRRLNVPTPGRGYWAKVAHGQSDARPPLPPARTGDQTKAVIRASQLPPTKDRYERDVLAISVPADLRPDHPAVLRLKKEIDRREIGRDGVVLVAGATGSLLRTSQPAVERALGLLSTLFKALEACGHSIHLGPTKDPRGQPGFSMAASVGGHSVSIQIAERFTRTEHVPTARELAKGYRPSSAWAPRYDFTPTGNLTMTIEHQYGTKLQSSWSDGERRKLESQLGHIVVGIEQSGAAIAEQRRVLEAQRLEQEEAARRAEDDRKKAEFRAAAGEDLENMADAWNRATQLRMFLEAVRATLPEGLGGERTRSWFKWALEHADKIDPLREPHSIATLLAEADGSPAPSRPGAGSP
jgi:hypothetical protein